ncbi:hypothetical protein B0H14DRAFT_2754447 [Mycena olivaceomarginata]|nr:hypothetical protein B0H14DRAFT_2754447 [Mycena olivaceomarginata]
MASRFTLPPELEREILETAALRYPEMIPPLLRICRRAQIWLEPLLYRVVDLSHEPQLLAAESKDPTFLQHAVRNVHASFENRPDAISRYNKLLWKCPGIINLSVDFNLDDIGAGALREMRLKKLAVTVPSVISTWYLAGCTDALFKSITHLDLFQGPRKAKSEWRHWRGLARLPALTHLALSPTIAIDILADVVVECPRLTLVVVTMYSWDSLAVKASLTLRVTDSRVVLMIMASTYPIEWKLGALGGDDFWVRAETFIDRRRTGEIDSTCYLLDENATTQPLRFPINHRRT